MELIGSFLVLISGMFIGSSFDDPDYMENVVFGSMFGVLGLFLILFS